MKIKSLLILFVIFADTNQVVWSQSIDSVLISSKEYRNAKRNLLEYKKLINDHKIMQSAYLDLKSKYDKLSREYKSKMDIRPSEEVASIRLAYDNLMMDYEANRKTIIELKDIYLFLRSQLPIYNRRQAKRFKKTDDVWSKAKSR